ACIGDEDLSLANSSVFACTIIISKIDEDSVRNTYRINDDGIDTTDFIVADTFLGCRYIVHHLEHIRVKVFCSAVVCGNCVVKNVLLVFLTGTKCDKCKNK